MADLYSQGIQNPFSQLGAIVVPIEGVAVNFMVNRNPLFARLTKPPKGAQSFKVASNAYRPNSTTMNNGGTLNSSATSVVVLDASVFMQGDVIEIDTESMLVSADPVISTNTLTIVRGYAGTSAASHNDLTVVFQIGNSRTGGEVLQNAITRLPKITTQQLQTFQHPYQISGALASDTAFALPPGMANVVGFFRSLAIQECTDDIERTCYYGYGVTPGQDSDRPQMTGLRSLIQTNKTLSPTNFAAYKPSDLIRDTIQAGLTGGGKINLMVMSADWIAGLAIWGMAVQRVPAGTNSYGTPIDVFECPFLGAGVELVFAPLLRNGTVIGLTKEEVMLGTKRPLFDKPRGSRGDVEEGDIIGEYGIELHNEQHHAFVSGITGYSPS